MERTAFRVIVRIEDTGRVRPTPPWGVPRSCPRQVPRFRVLTTFCESRVLLRVPFLGLNLPK